MFPTFGRFLLLALLRGMIRGHDRVDGLIPVAMAGDPALLRSLPPDGDQPRIDD